MLYYLSRFLRCHRLIETLGARILHFSTVLSLQLSEERLIKDTRKKEEGEEQRRKEVRKKEGEGKKDEGTKLQVEGLVAGDIQTSKRKC